MSAVQKSEESIYTEEIEQIFDNLKKIDAQKSNAMTEIYALAENILKQLDQLEENELFYQEALLRETVANFRLHHAKMQLEKVEEENEKLKEQLEVMKLTGQLQEDVAKMLKQKEPLTEKEAMQLVMKTLEEQGNARRVTEKILDEAVKQKTGTDLINKLFPQNIHK